MPGIANTGGAWNEREKADLVGQVVTGALSVREACARYNLSQECIRDWIVVFRRSAVEAFDEHLRQTLVSQGIDAGDISSGGFTGTLGDIALADLIQTMDLGRRDGVIAISHDGRESRIWCAAGEIVDAESGKLRGEPALYRALALKNGRVVADFSCAPRHRTIHSATLPLLIDGARRMDECNVLVQRLGLARYVLAPKAMSADATFSADERALLRCFYTPSAVADALAENEIGDLETLKAISLLVAKDYLSAELESSMLPVAALPPDTPSTPPVVMSFFSPMKYQRARRSRSRKGSLGSVIGLAVLGLTWWLLPNRLFESSSAEGHARAPVPRANSAGSETASGADEVVSGAERVLSEADRPPSSASYPPDSASEPPSSTEPVSQMPWSRPEVALGLEIEPHARDALLPSEAMLLRQATAARGASPSAGKQAQAAAKTNAAPAPSSLRQVRPNSASASFVEQTMQQPAGHGASSSPEGTESIREPRMQIIEEQPPRMQIVE